MRLGQLRGAGGHHTEAKRFVSNRRTGGRGDLASGHGAKSGMFVKARGCDTTHAVDDAGRTVVPPCQTSVRSAMCMVLREVSRVATVTADESHHIQLRETPCIIRQVRTFSELTGKGPWTAAAGGHNLRVRAVQRPGPATPSKTGEAGRRGAIVPAPADLTLEEKTGCKGGLRPSAVKTPSQAIQAEIEISEISLSAVRGTPVSEADRQA